MSYYPSHYKIVFMSSAPIGIPFLQAIADDDRFELVGVATMPDAPVGRGLQLQPNIIKAHAQTLINTGHIKSKKRVILMHGKTHNPTHNRYPRFIDQCRKHHISIDVPELPDTNDPDLQVWIDVLVGLKPDQDTILIGHSAGGSAILHALQSGAIAKVSNIILVTSPNGDITHKINPKPYNISSTRYGGVVDYPSIKSHITNTTTIIHSQDDTVINYSVANAHIQGLGATLISHTDRGHYHSDQLPELRDCLQYIISTDLIATPVKINPDKSKEGAEFASWLRKKEADFLVVIAYGKILPQSILDIPHIAPINVHGSILPAYRGATPIQSVLLDGQTQTGLTIIHMDAGCDTGAMIQTLKFEIGADRTSQDIIKAMKKVGPQCLCDTLRAYGVGDLTDQVQDETQATTCGKIQKTDGLIDPWSDSLLSIYRKYQAYYLWPKIFFEYQGRQHLITKLVLDHDQYRLQEQKTLFGADQSLHPAVVDILIQPASKKPISYADWSRGYNHQNHEI